MRIQGIIPPSPRRCRPTKTSTCRGSNGTSTVVLISGGVHGIFVLGTNSEFYALDEKEKADGHRHGGRARPRPRPGLRRHRAESTREVIRLTRMAEKEGVEGVSIITPYFVLPNQQEIFDHYRRIAETTKLPVVLYNNPGTCGGVKIDVDTCARLAEIPNILAIRTLGRPAKTPTSWSAPCPTASAC